MCTGRATRRDSQGQGQDGEGADGGGEERRGPLSLSGSQLVEGVDQDQVEDCHAQGLVFVCVGMGMGMGKGGGEGVKPEPKARTHA